MKGGANECNPSFPTSGHFEQGSQFMKMTSAFHGGFRKSRRNSKKMRSTRRMRGGSMFTPYADYPTSMNMHLPPELATLARTAPLDAKFAELPGVERAAGVPMAGGSRKNRKNRNNNKNNRRRKTRGGSAEITAPSMILQTPDEEGAARLNPQWYTENTVIPSFRGPIPVPGDTGPAPLPPAPPKAPVGGRRKSRRAHRRY